MFERFTDQSRRTVVLAQEEATRFNHNYIGTEHLLAGLRREKRGAAARALESAGITLDAIRGEIETLIGRGLQAPSGHVPFTPRAKKCLELSLREALKLDHQHIDTGHLLLALISQDDCVAGQVLGGIGADLEQLRARVIEEIEEIEEIPEDRGYSPPPRRRRVQLPNTVLSLLDTIDDRLSAIELQLGITRPGSDTEAGAGESAAENVVPPS